MELTKMWLGEETICVSVCLDISAIMRMLRNYLEIWTEGIVEE